MLFVYAKVQQQSTYCYLEIVSLLW